MPAYPEQRMSPYVLGIDFGTCTSISAIYTRGAVEFLPVEGEDIIIPSVVTFREGDSPLIGKQAKRSALLYPDKTVASVKMALGETQWTFSHDGKDYTPTDIVALILSYLHDGAHAQQVVNLEGTVKRVVLCVPANFEDNKRKALLHAAQNMVGLEVRLLEEPVAAAIAYGAQRDADTKILVYDLGGGTFDVAILHVRASADPDIANHFEVLAKGGLSKLGGDDFDRKLVERFAARIKADGGIDVLDLQKDQGVSLKKLKEAQQTLKELAEKVKIELTDAETVTVNVPSVITDEAGKAHGLKDETITRIDFEQLTRELLDDTMEQVQQTLNEAGMSPDEVDRIILAGGSTRMFMVKQRIKDVFGREPWSELDPATIVARGAALYGAGGIVEQNRTSHGLGVELLHQRFGKMIAKNTPLPARTEKIYQAVEVDPEAIRITIFQALEEIEHVMDGTCLGEFFLVIPEDKRKHTFRNVKVTMEMTEENLLKVRAEMEDEAGLFHEVEITN